MRKILQLVCVATCCCALLVESVAAQAQPTAAAEPPPPPPPAAAPVPAAPPAAPVQPPPPGAPQYAPPPPEYGQPAYGPPPPGYDYRYARRHRRPHRSMGMMIAGIALFGASYLGGAITGATLGSADNSDCDCDDAYRMLIPIAGPLTLLNASHHHDARPIINAFLITDTVLQSAGLVLTIFGIIRFANSGQEEMDEAMLRPPPFMVGATPLPGGGGMATFRLTL